MAGFVVPRSVNFSAAGESPSGGAARTPIFWVVEGHGLDGGDAHSAVLAMMTGFGNLSWEFVQFSAIDFIIGTRNFAKNCHDRSTGKIAWKKALGAVALLVGARNCAGQWPQE